MEQCYECGKSVKVFKARSSKGGICGACYSANTTSQFQAIINSNLDTNSQLNVPTIICALMGHGGTGKTSLATVMSGDKFPTDYCPMILSSLSFSKVIQQSININVWDTANTSDYDQLIRMICPLLDLAIFCYSCDDESSLLSLEGMYKQIATTRDSNLPAIILLGNKMDVKVTSKIQHTQVQQVTKNIGAVFTLECSALTKEGVDQLEIKIVEAVQIATNMQVKQPGSRCNIS